MVTTVQHSMRLVFSLNCRVLDVFITKQALLRDFSRVFFFNYLELSQMFVNMSESSAV